MKLDTTCFRYLTSVEWRVLVAIEMGSKNHEIVPTVLIARIANLRRHGIHQILSTLLKHKLIAHDGSSYEGYKLSYLGYDLLALRALVSRGTLEGVGARIGVGKESDVHLCQNAQHVPVILKIHRLGRISFRTVKKNRDYLGHRHCASWMYMARLAAAKEYAYMKALYHHGFPVPEPIDLNRHVLVMSHIDARPLAHFSKLNNPHKVLEDLMSLIVRFAEAGLIHGDFNAFNLLLDEDENLTVIDFPQIIRVHHPDAEFYFDRDVKCIRSLFKSKFRIELTKYPKFHQINKPPLPHSLAVRKNLLNEDKVLEQLKCLGLRSTKQNASDSSSSSSSSSPSRSSIQHTTSFSRNTLQNQIDLTSLEWENLDSNLDLCAHQRHKSRDTITGKRVSDQSQGSETSQDDENSSTHSYLLASPHSPDSHSRSSNSTQYHDSDTASVDSNSNDTQGSITHCSHDESSHVSGSTEQKAIGHHGKSSASPEPPTNRLDHTWTPLVPRRPKQIKKPRQGASQKMKIKGSCSKKKVKSQKWLLHQALNFT